MSILEAHSIHTKREYPLRLAVLGSSGSVGSQTLAVCRNHPDKLKLKALAVLKSCESAVKDAIEFDVDTVIVADESHKHDACLSELPSKVDLRLGQCAVFDVCSDPDIDVVVIAVVGAIGMRACYEALKAGKIVAVANKEPLVIAGDILMPLAEPGKFLPIDSEHSALFQCLLGEDESSVRRLLLTCSGGPFFGYSKEQLKGVTLNDALKHPSWSMGSKITIDSATLMNKGFEVIEAHHLFGIDYSKIEVLVHRTSQVHSMVEFIDGQVKALFGASNMQGAIQFALSYPYRWNSSIPFLNYASEKPIEFHEVDRDTFRCLALAEQSGKAGGILPCVLNAANEVANLAFREEKCSFIDISNSVEYCLEKFDNEPIKSLEQLEAIDLKAREITSRWLTTLER